MVPTSVTPSSALLALSPFRPLGKFCPSVEGYGIEAEVLSETRTFFSEEVGGAAKALSLKARSETSTEVNWVEGATLL